MFEYFQPKNEGSIKNNLDCQLRAICAVTGADYDEVYKKMKEGGWRTNRSSSKGDWTDNIVTTLEHFGFKARKISFPAVAGQKRMSIEKFVDTYTTGQYIIRVSKHVAGVVDGTVKDTWIKWDKCVYFAWEVYKAI